VTLGYPSAEALQQDMTSHQFAEVLAFQRIEPLGQRREDYRTAIIAAAIRNLFAERDDQLVQPQDVLDEVFDFWPDEAIEEEVTTPEEIAEQEDNLIRMATEWFGAENRV